MNSLRSFGWLVVGFILGLAPCADAQPRVDAAGDPLPDGARLRIGTMRFRSAGAYLNAGSLAPDGKTIAISNGLAIRLLEVDTGNEVRRFGLGESTTTYPPYYTADRREIITFSYHNVSFYDVAEAKLLRQVAINPLYPTAGALCAGAGAGQALRQVDINRPNVIAGTTVSLSADGKLLAQVSTSQDRGVLAGRVTVTDLEANRELINAPTLHNFSIQQSVSPGGKWLATWGLRAGGGVLKAPAKEPEKGPVARPEAGNPNRIVQLWDVAAGKEKCRLTTDLDQVQTVRFSSDCSKVVTAGSGMIQLWDVATGKLERRFACRIGQGSSVAFSPDGQVLAASGPDSTVQQWDVTTGKKLGTCEGPAVQTTQLQYRPDGQLLAWGVYGTALHIWEAPSGKRLTPEGGHQGGVYGLFFVSDGKTLISAGRDGRVLRWDPTTGKELDSITLKKGHDETRHYPPGRGLIAYGTQCAFSPNGKYMVGGASEYRPASAVFDLSRGVEIFSLVSSNSPVEGAGPVLFSPDSSKVTILGRYSAGPPPEARSITLWEVETALPLPPLMGHQGDLTAGGFSTDGQFLAIASHQRTADREKKPPFREQFEVWVWNIAAGNLRTKIKLPQRCMGLLFLDERRFLAGIFQTGWRLYDAVDGKEVGTFEGNGAPLTAPPVLSPDRRLVAAGVASVPRVKPDGTSVPSTARVNIWEAASGTLRCELTGHQGSISALAFAPNGRTLATGSSDTTIVLWDLARKAENQPALKPDELDALWKVLDEQSAKTAEEAMRKLAARPGEVIPFLREHLKAAEGPLDAATLTYLVGQLDAGRYATREAAGKRLERVGKPAVEPLRAALKANPSLELKERVEKLLTRIERTHGMAPWWQSLRGIEVLERIGSPEAKELLASLAKGAEGAPSTRMAAEALERLRK
jgi:WD40 repeat protein